MPARVPTRAGRFGGVYSQAPARFPLRDSLVPRRRPLPAGGRRVIARLMERPVCLPFAELCALRPVEGVPGISAGIWCVGSLEGLRRPVVAVVGTRAATAY